MRSRKMWPSVLLGFIFVSCLRASPIGTVHSRELQDTIIALETHRPGGIGFIKELSLRSNKNDEKTSFLSATLVDVDSQGNIYVLSSREKKIQVYNPKGVYLRTIGKIGNAPDEFETPIYMVLDKKDNLYVFDYRKAAFLVFDSRGQFIDIFGTQGKYKEIPDKIVVDSQQNIIIGSTFGSSEAFKISRFNKEFNLLEDIYVQKGTFYNLRIVSGQMIGPPRYAPTVIWTMDDSENLYVCYNKHYEIEVYLPNRKIKQKIVGRYIPEEILITEIESELQHSMGQLKLNDFPKYKPAICGLYIIKDYIFSLTKKRIGQYYYDIFDRNGNMVGKTSLAFVPAIYKNNYVYSITYNKDSSDYEVIRYKVEVR